MGYTPGIIKGTISGNPISVNSVIVGYSDSQPASEPPEKSLSPETRHYSTLLLGNTLHLTGKPASCNSWSSLRLQLMRYLGDPLFQNKFRPCPVGVDIFLKAKEVFHGF